MTSVLAPVIAGLAVGISFIVLFSIMAIQMPTSINSSIEVFPEVIDTNIRVPTPTGAKNGEDVDNFSLKPYAIIPVGKSKEMIISNSGWGMWMRHVKTLMTIDSITVYYNDYRLQQSMPDLFELKEGFFAVFFNYTMKNLGDEEYYAGITVDVIVKGKTYPGRASGGALSSPLYLGESKSSWQALEIPEDADEVTLEIRDGETDRKVWTIQLDMQPYGLKPSKYSNRQDFSKLPEDFALVYSYSYGRDITLDTKKGLIIVKTCNNPPMQNITLNLSKEQLQTIWLTVLENDFFDLPDFTESCPGFGECIGIAPESSAVMKVTAYNQTHRVDFRQTYEMNLNTYSSDFTKYKEIRTMIEEMVAQYELPQSKCAYL